MDPGVVVGEGQQTVGPLRRQAQGPEVEDPMADQEQSTRVEVVVEEVGSCQLAKEA